MKMMLNVTVVVSILLLSLCVMPSFVYRAKAEGYDSLDYSGNYCLNFSSVIGDYVVFGSSPVFYSAALTFEAWINPEYIIKATSSSQYGHTAGMISTTRSATASGNPGWQIYFDYVGGALHFSFNSAAPVATWSNNTIRQVWYNNTWYAIAVTYDPTLPSGNIKFYVNGTLDSQHDENHTISYAQAGPLEIGLLPGNIDNGHPWGGLMDEVRVWNISRTQADIQSDWNRTLDSTEMANPDLVGYWRFDEGSGGTSHDYSIYQNDAALASAPNNPQWVNPGAPIVIVPEFSPFLAMLIVIIPSSFAMLLVRRRRKNSVLRSHKT